MGAHKMLFLLVKRPWRNLTKIHFVRFCLNLEVALAIVEIDSELKHCSVDRLSRLSVQQLEILSQEKYLDQVISYNNQFLVLCNKLAQFNLFIN